MLFRSVALFAQDPASKIVLAKGQKIMVTTTVAISSSNMGMNADVNSRNENMLEVKQVTDKESTITSTLTKMKMDVDAPGNSTSYDSEKKEDQETEMGKSMSEKLNKATDITVDNTTGAVVNAPKAAQKKDGDNASPGMDMLSMLGDSGSDDVVVSGAFQVIPKGKKPGDSWLDSTIDKDTKVRRTYNFKSNADSGAVIQLVTTIESSGTIEMMGMNLEMNTTTETTSNILLDAATGLVKKRSTEANVSGSMSVMGQSIPISAKATTISVYK